MYSINIKFDAVVFKIEFYGIFMFTIQIYSEGRYKNNNYIIIIPPTFKFIYDKFLR